MAIPKYYEFMKPILDYLKDDKMRDRKEIYEALVRLFQISEEELKMLLPSGKQLIYKNRIGWALTYLKKAGLIDSPLRSKFRISQSGKNVLLENPAIITANYLNQFESFRGFLEVGDPGNNNQPDPTNEKQTPQDALDEAFNTITNTLKEEVLDTVLRQSPELFEKLVVDLLVAMGYGGSKTENRQITRYSGDEGIDGIIKEDKLGFDKIYLQAKRWGKGNTIGRPEIQKFVGALTGQGAAKGAFITTASFSRDAQEYANNQHAYKIVLIDGSRLAELMIEHNLGVAVESSYEIKRIDSDYFNE